MELFQEERWPRPLLAVNSYVAVLDARQLSLQDLDPLALGQHHGTQRLHLRQELVQHVVLEDRDKSNSSVKECKTEVL